MAFLLDASFVIALLDPKDQWHKAAKAAWPMVAKDPVRLVHTFTIMESVNTVAPRRGGKLAQIVYDTLWDECQVVEPDRRMLDDAMDVVLRFDGGLSLSDALSVHVVQSRRLKAIVSFDRDFDAAGIARVPKA